MDIIDFDLFVLSKIELIIKLKLILVEVKYNFYNAQLKFTFDKF